MHYEHMILTNAILGIFFTAGVLGTSEYRIPDHERVDNQNFSRFLFKLLGANRFQLYFEQSFYSLSIY